jgi:hypothetical protein
MGAALETCTHVMGHEAVLPSVEERVYSKV